MLAQRNKSLMEKLGQRNFGPFLRSYNLRNVSRIDGRKILTIADNQKTKYTQKKQKNKKQFVFEDKNLSSVRKSISHFRWRNSHRSLLDNVVG